MVLGAVSYYGKDKITKINKSTDHKCSYSLVRLGKLLAEPHDVWIL